MENYSSHMKLLNEDMVATRDWRKALKSPPAYRIINRTIRGQTQFITAVAVIGLFVLCIVYIFPKKSATTVLPEKASSSNYNFTYPLTSPLKTFGGTHTFRIDTSVVNKQFGWNRNAEVDAGPSALLPDEYYQGIIADLDTKSKSDTDKNTWYSYFKKGYLTYNPRRKDVVVTWDHTGAAKLTSSFSLKGRGMELSELVVFNGKLLAFDDRTGLIYEINNDKAIPWVLLIDGDGRTTKGFKSEWATVKDQILYVGSMGKEWTTSGGQFENNDPQFVKSITVRGEVKHVNWVEEYKRIRSVLDIQWPGYMIHESGVWSDVHQKWFFLPRRCSKEHYNETLDESRGCSVLISTDSGLHDFKIIQLPNSHPSRGFSSFKFVPTSNDQVIVALRTEELDGKTATYITAFTVGGEIVLDDLLVSDLKYEGLEFI